MMSNIYVGCAGWSIAREQASQFEPDDGGSEDGTSRRSHLERYALRLTAVEINSSFYRPHRPATYARWAASVPADFRFSVKLPRQITHVQRLRASDEVLIRFLGEAEALEQKLGPILVQLPPSLGFDETIASAFFETLRERFSGSVVCEPRHPSWFQPEAEQTLQRFKVGRVAADPALPVPEASRPGGWDGIQYFRLHGSPRIYYSDYSEAYLTTLTRTLKQAALPKTPETTKTVWCIFDNTAMGAATANALSVLESVSLPGKHYEDQ